MRLWTLHPRYLDPPGLTALWREGLLARDVLAGRSRGYHRHPQLERFREHPEPRAAIAAYLYAVFEESERRGFAFDESRIGRWRPPERIPETEGQLLFEWDLVREKLRGRSSEWFARTVPIARPLPHPFFKIIPGGVRSWERALRF